MTIMTEKSVTWIKPSITKLEVINTLALCEGKNFSNDDAEESSTCSIS